jgi:hypothetical protein
MCGYPIVEVAGKCRTDRVILPAGTAGCKINIVGYDPGLYFLQVIKAEQIEIHRFIVK